MSKARAKPDFNLLKGARVYRGYQPTQAGPEQNPPQSASGIIPFYDTDALAALTLLRNAIISPDEYRIRLGYSVHTGIDEIYATPQEVGCVDYEEL